MPGTGRKGFWSVMKKVCEVRVAGATGVLNMILNGAFVSTPVAPFGGLVKAEPGAVLFAARPVVKELWKGWAIRFPPASRTFWTTTVYVVEAERFSVGVKVRDSLSLERLTDPAMGRPFWRT